MSLNKTLTLNDGNKIPQIGLGTWLSKPGEVANAVEVAIKAGYRHIDCALIYQNSTEVGEAFKKTIPSVVKREDLFVTSKLWNNAHKPELVEAAYNETLQELGLEYLDLYLIHWPVAFKDGKDLVPKSEDGKQAALDRQTSIVDTWKALVKLQKEGKVKSIGVSNFTTDDLDAVINATGVTPAVNQIEAHPLLPQDDLVAYAKSKNIHLTAYSPLGNNLNGKTKIVDYPQVSEVAKKYNADPAQVLVAWGVKRGYSVIPKSVTESRIKSNFDQLELKDEDYEKVTSLYKELGKVRFNVPKTYVPFWDIDIFGEEAEQGATYKVNRGN
ncbi:NADP-dependent oxidoreductase domain protein [Kalmanozyma brasiliensis GHG001]|uniref:Aldehyde reductase 1 n=1 Tax=Kalmanozyma brasiliensis (strain GHG001) TaxID=1365824 RepID=V5ERV5_KALBG|nr:NADP-dependent oxidoreductase domain protein [Kalmanozyma brasiliensis GHG001]EST04584.1 NADP-dependent oxidoreductase domain protein [Kalmanozyma brasiliensis GHG001]